MKKAKSRVAAALSLLPWLWILGLIALVIRARLVLGYWPNPSHPDPKLLPFALHYSVLLLGFYVVSGLFPLITVAYLLSTVFSKRKFAQQPFWAFTSGVALIAVMFFSPPFSINWVAWFLD